MTRRRTCAPTIPLADHVREHRLDGRLGDYRMVAPLARGGTASVYRAEHVDTKEPIALKVLNPLYADKPEVVERLFAEHAISQRVSHPSLVEVVVAGRSLTGIPYVGMELLDGENLRALMNRGAIAIDAVLAICIQVAGALAALHGANVAHCDVKSDNIIVLYEKAPGGFPRVKVIDYGVATRLDQQKAEDDQTIAGTPSCMAPEQWRGAPVARTDVYGLGCLLYELICGEAPFHGTLPQLMQAHIELLPERLSVVRTETPTDIEYLVMRMLAKDPQMRPTMSDVELELATIALARLPGAVSLPIAAATAAAAA